MKIIMRGQYPLCRSMMPIFFMERGDINLPVRQYLLVVMKTLPLQRKVYEILLNNLLHCA